MKISQLAALQKKNAAPQIIDVRSRPEFRHGHIPGAVHVPLWKLLLPFSSIPADKDALCVVVCEHGPRAQLAKSSLLKRGFTRVELLEGHMSGWRRQGMPLD